MFYSETLLSKTGPLARVWLSANLERKLSKTHILQSNIESSVSAIVDQGQAPMALRLSGQLLLGVVRIYSRKARYLLDDCNEALMKIKMAFRPGNVDLPSNQMHAPNPATLTLPDVLTELDLLPPLPDASLLLTQPPGSAPEFDFDRSRVGRDEDITLQSSMLDPYSIEQGRGGTDEMLQLEEGDELDLDIGDDLGVGGDDTSMHVGRDAAPARPVEDDLVSEDMKLHDGDMLDLDIGDDNISRHPGDHEFIFRGDEDFDMGAGAGFDLNMDDRADDTHSVARQTPPRLERDSHSPLSSIRSSMERNLEHNYRRNLDSTIFEPEEEDESMHHNIRTKKRKVLQPDADTVLHSTQIKQQQKDRSRILKPASFLPRDPIILTLMAMQRSGGFVSSILGDGRGKGWAPELKGLLSLEVVRRVGELKRKRDIGIEDADDDAEKSLKGKQPRLEIIEDEEADFSGRGMDLDGDATIGAEIIELPADDGFLRQDEEDGQGLPLGQQEEEGDEDALSPVPDNFDDTIAPLVHPADSGPVSIGTKHAVHLLRERFGTGASESSSQLKKASVLFQELLPEPITTKADATKMFFEVLVLATKDAVKVEQQQGVLGGPIRVRGKRGLWGDWAEREAGGEIVSQEVPTESAAVTVEN
ncbi:MAG: sister chromatid cohesion protein 1 [Geoglossum umbratile]|nr:MAG: sister chromatid cohesion protein 1 [Geoglossum umbratile]